MEMSALGAHVFSLPAALAYPPIDPIAFQVGPFAVHWYGLAYVAGFIVASLVIWRLSQRWQLGLTPDDVLEIILAAVVGVVVGGRLGYVLLYGAGAYWAQPEKIVALWDGGMSFHGGLAGILVAGYVISRWKRIPFLTVCDLGAVGAPAGLFFGRLANFVNAELWGRTTDIAWGMVFPGAGTLPRHPSQLYEAALEGVVLLVVMVLLARKLPPRPRGELLGWLLVLYSVFRIAVEFFREPDVQIGFIAGGATMGQLLSIPMLAGGVWLLLRARRLGLPQAGPRVEGLKGRRSA